jgi:putative ABC transport system permease protein
MRTIGQDLRYALWTLRKSPGFEAVGLGGAVLLTRTMSALLYGVSPHDPVTFGAIAAILVAVALAGTWSPARRASRVDPMVALRSEG